MQKFVGRHKGGENPTTVNSGGLWQRESSRLVGPKARPKGGRWSGRLIFLHYGKVLMERRVLASSEVPE